MVADAACRDLSCEEADAYFFPERGQTAAKGRELCRSGWYAWSVWTRLCLSPEVGI
jgi:hypothetical protein